MLYTTFRLARNVGACASSCREMIRALGGIRAYGQDTPIPLTRVLDACGLMDALWALTSCASDHARGHRTARQFACDCVEHVLPLYEAQNPGGPHLRRAADVVRRYAEGLATDRELVAVRRRARGIYAIDRSSISKSMYESLVWAGDPLAFSAVLRGITAAIAVVRQAGRDVEAERQWQTQRLRQRLEEA